jgi:hypothetical protein
MKPIQNAWEAKMARVIIKRDSRGRRTDRVKRYEIVEMVRLNAQGLTDSEIAGRLKRKKQTVKRHLKEEAAKTERKLHDKMQTTLQDPLIIEAKKKHLDEIETMLRSWRDEIEFAQSRGTHTVVDALEKDLDSFLFPELRGLKNSCFPYALKHCPLINNLYQTFKTQKDQFNLIKAKLMTAIEAESKVLLEEAECSGKLVICWLFFSAIWNEDSSYFANEPDYREEGREQDFFRSMNVYGALDRCSGLIRKYQNDHRITELLDIRKHIIDSRNALYEAIVQTLIKRSFISGKCDACPTWDFN